MTFIFRALICGGGAPEIHMSRQISQYAQSLKGMEAYCFQAYADALEVIPTTLAENAGLNSISIVTELRNRHALGERNAGINVRTVRHIHDPKSHPTEHYLRRASSRISKKRK
jgi:T-complex protein 1 subunit delta